MEKVQKALVKHRKDDDASKIEVQSKNGDIVIAEHIDYLRSPK